MTQPKLTRTPTTNIEHSYQSFFYNSSSYIHANSGQEPLHFYYEEDGIKAHLAICIEGELAVSLLRAPFGGLEFDSKTSPVNLTEWLKELEQAIKVLGIKELLLHQPPQSYQDQSVINAVFKSLDYQVIEERVFHSIEVRELSLAERMHGMEKRRLQKAIKAGCELKVYQNDSFHGIYEQIRNWRDLSAKPLSMQWTDLNDAKQRNPHAYMAFGLELEGIMIAATILVRVNHRILYNFFPASDENYKQLSPMVMLIDGIYNWCQANKVELLDLGTSYLEGKKKASLVQFKENIGGRSSIALSWRKTLS